MLIIFVLMVVKGSLVEVGPMDLAVVIVLFLGHHRPSLWVVIRALQSSDAVHLGFDILNVVRHVGCLLDWHRCSTPVELALLLWSLRSVVSYPA